jgi:hypothetical protein
VIISLAINALEKAVLLSIVHSFFVVCVTWFHSAISIVAIVGLKATSIVVGPSISVIKTTVVKVPVSILVVSSVLVVLVRRTLTLTIAIEN